MLFVALENKTPPWYCPVWGRGPKIGFCPDVGQRQPPSDGNGVILQDLAFDFTLNKAHVFFGRKFCPGKTDVSPPRELMPTLWILLMGCILSPGTALFTIKVLTL